MIQRATIHGEYLPLQETGRNIKLTSIWETVKYYTTKNMKQQNKGDGHIFFCEWRTGEVTANSVTYFFTETWVFGGKFFFFKEKSGSILERWKFVENSFQRKEEEAAPIACLSPSRGTTRPGRRTVEVLNTPVKETFTLEVANNSVKEMVDEEVSAIPLSPIKMVSLKNSR